jgi:hypothetical protein
VEPLIVLGTQGVGTRAAGAWATLLADWRRFLDPRFRTFHRLALLQGLMVLAGFDVIIPFALAIGCPPAVAALIGALPVAGGMAQLAVPRLLARSDGNLRGLTLLATAIGEGRGIVYCLIAIGVALGVLGSLPALILLALVIFVAGVLSSVSGANLLAWYSAVLVEEDRRLVVPRLMVVAMAASALLLFPMGILLDVLAGYFGLAVYAVPFALAGVFGVAEVLAVRRLPRPGRVIVPPRAMGEQAPETPAERQFLRVSTVNALGMGLTPFFSVYAISVLGLSAGFSMTMSAVSLVAMVVAAAIGGGMLARGSSARQLRASFAIRALALFLPILALPGTLLAPLLMYATAALASVGFAIGQLAANERMFRLVRGPTVIRQYGRLLFRTSAAMTTGQVVSGVVLAVVPMGYLGFAALFGASSAVRVYAWRAARTEAKPRESGAALTPSAAAATASPPGGS